MKSYQKTTKSVAPSGLFDVTHMTRGIAKNAHPRLLSSGPPGLLYNWLIFVRKRTASYKLFKPARLEAELTPGYFLPCN